MGTQKCSCVYKITSETHYIAVTHMKNQICGYQTFLSWNLIFDSEIDLIAFISKPNREIGHNASLVAVETFQWSCDISVSLSFFSQLLASHRPYFESDRRGKLRRDGGPSHLSSIMNPIMARYKLKPAGGRTQWGSNLPPSSSIWKR